MGLKLKLAKSALYAGTLGFVACWAIGWTMESRVFSSPEFSEISSDRTEPTRVKGKIYYLEPTASAAFWISNISIVWAFGLALIGGAYVERRKRQNHDMIKINLSERLATADE